MTRWIWTVVLATFILSVVFTILLNLGYLELSSPPPKPEPRTVTDPEEAWREWTEALLAELAEAEPAYTSRQAEAWADGLIPLVETCAGRSFERRPHIRLVDRQALTNRLAAMSFRELLQQFPDIDEQCAWEIAWSDASVSAMSFLGLYEPGGDTVYLTPTNVEPIMRMAGVAQEDLDVILRLVITHELTHALQDQHVDLSEQLNAAYGGQEVEALLAMIEGHATFVEELVGRRLGLDEAVLELAGLITAGAAPSKHEPFGKLRRFVELTHERRYLGGRDFVRYHHERGGTETVWAILASPPARMSVILQPATYGAPLQVRDYSGVLPGLERLLHLGDATGTAPNLAQGLLSAFSGLPADVILDAAAYLDDVQNHSFSFDIVRGRGELTLLVVTDASFGRRMAEIAEGLVLRELEKRKRTGAVKVRDERQGELNGIQADFARTVSYGMQIPGGPPLSTHFAVVSRGLAVLEILTFHLEVDDADLVRLAEEAFRRVESAPVFDVEDGWEDRPGYSPPDGS